MTFSSNGKMTEERLDPADTPTDAASIVHALITFKVPKTADKYPEWSERVKHLQNLLSKHWQNDRTGRIMVECLNFLYDAISLYQTPVSPAAWCILDLVEEDKISEIVEGILNDKNINEASRVQNALNAIIDGLCKYGPRVPSLQSWAIAILHGLEERRKFDILTSVAEFTILKQNNVVLMPAFRRLVYPVFRLFLYSVVTPNVFHKIIPFVPQTIEKLVEESDDEDTKFCLYDFAGILCKLLIRFADGRPYDPKYNSVRLALKRLPVVAFEPESLTLWDPAQIRNTSGRTDSYKISNKPYKGLINQGNTCFMNSVLQLLYMTIRFRNEILMKNVDVTERLASELQELFAFMQESARRVLVPIGVLNTSLPPTFRRGYQQDSSEYLIYLLDTLHENEKKVIRKRKKDCSRENKMEGNGDFEQGTSSVKDLKEYNYTIVERLFGGISMSTTTCSYCKKSFPKTDTFRDLHLTFPDDERSFDLQELINLSLEPEELCSENMYDCSNCGMKRNATRKQMITKAPEHLILTLKLFRFDTVKKQRLKINGKLENTETIELPVFHPSQSETKVTYDVKGVVFHSGSSLDSGHYFSSAVDSNGKCYLFNDAEVTSIENIWRDEGTPYIFLLKCRRLSATSTVALSPSLHLLVNRDTQKFLTEKRNQKKKMIQKKNIFDFGDDDDDDDDDEDDDDNDVDDDDDDDDEEEDSPPGNGSFEGPGPSLVF